MDYLNKRQIRAVGVLTERGEGMRCKPSPDPVCSRHACQRSEEPLQCKVLSGREPMRRYAARVPTEPLVICHRSSFPVGEDR
jgi:hypothetical protein